MTRDFSLHESYQEAEPVSGSSDRSFGCTVGSVLIVLGAVKSALAGMVTIVAGLMLAAGAILLLFGILAPSRLAPLNRLWLRLGLALATVVNPVIMALLFYLLFTPMAILLRLSGKRPLRLASDPGADSYWLPRQPEERRSSDMRRQF